ncbi:hypothetical protein [Klebsiella pneumoniae]|uniref:hypothetical protein n=1 Tax=Klebsiella pneumoniae TaxID=573 RepID=UPI001E437E09
MSGVLQSNIPVKVRYALEKTALDKSVSPLAIRYEQNVCLNTHTFSKASVNCLKVGSPVAFVGVLFALLGIKNQAASQILRIKLNESPVRWAFYSVTFIKYVVIYRNLLLQLVS